LNKYYALETNGNEADIYIFGDITSWEWLDSDVSSYTLSKELNELDTKVETINVHINSYGGEVAEGLAIYNMLRNHKAKVRTYCDGFACSIASVIFMAGDERIMNNSSLLMIHNAWMYTAGNAAQLRKDADDLDVITQASIEAYKSCVNITEDELKEILDAETWVLPNDALEKGFATSIIGEAATEKAAASARKSLFALVSQRQTEQTLAPVLESTEIDVDALAGKLYERITAEIKKQGEPESPKENKTINFFNAIIGRKE
jgi:ATP-dependent Clp protease protease subunit